MCVITLVQGGSAAILLLVGANATAEGSLNGKRSMAEALRHFCASDQFHYTVARFTVPVGTMFLKFAVNRFQADD